MPPWWEISKPTITQNPKLTAKILSSIDKKIAPRFSRRRKINNDLNDSTKD